MGKGAVIFITLLFLVILFPITSTSGNINFGEKIIIGKEYEIIFDNSITYEDWLNIEEQNLIPLRQTDKNKILVWSEMESFEFKSEKNKLSLIKNQHDSILSTEDVGFDVLKSPIYRVLLEPHLPQSGVIQVLELLTNYGYEILEYPPIRDVGSIPSSFEIRGQIPMDFDIAGVWKFEEVKNTFARNDVAGSIIESGSLYKHELWERGLNGQGILIGVADTGIDYDHSCFRENESEIGFPSEEHRKIKLINSSIDSGDYQNNSDYGHGTHIAGSLACNWSTGELKEGTSLSFNSKLLVQDIVSEEGWLPPENVELLFLEAAQNGAIIHSDSWGDNEVNYTERSGRFDSWGREVPWSLIFVAPGNSGGQLMEPANARNVIAVGSTTKEENLELVSHSSVGPTDLGTRGIFLVAPGKNIISAKSDGLLNSMNNDTKSLSGTSMSTPIAASGAAILQQMVEEGYFRSGMNENERMGFTPSGPLMKALLALATTSISDSNAPNPNQGWGVMNLSELLGLEFLENKNSSLDDVWVWDSYQFEGNWSSFIDSRMGSGTNPLESLTFNSWNGYGAKGPFLSTGEQIRWNFTVDNNKDLEARLSWLAKPEPYIVDDLQLSILTSDGRVANSNDYDNNGFSNLNDFEIEVSSDNETTVGIHIKKQDLVDVEWIHVIVDANYVGVGNFPNSIGIEGDRVGFGLAIKGIQNEEEIKLDGGEILDLQVDNVLGYTYVGNGGIYEQKIFENKSEIVWNFSEQPGVLNLELAIDEPRNISISLSKNLFGFRSIAGLGGKAVMPICSENKEESMSINPNSRKWTLEGIWWPPSLEDCKENKINFNLQNNLNNSLNSMSKLESWIENNQNYIVFEAEINLSSLANIWNQNELIPNQLVCKYHFGDYYWEDCDISNSIKIAIPEKSSVLQIKWEWVENDGLEREYLIEYTVPDSKNKENVNLGIDYLSDNRNSLVLIGEYVSEIPIILINEKGDNAYFKLVNNSWNLNEITMECNKTKYQIMTLNHEEENSFTIGKKAVVLDESDISISAVELNYSWDEKIILGKEFYLQLENKDLEHIISLPLRNITSLELQGNCEVNEMKSSNFYLEGVFLTWILLSIIMLISGLAISKKQRLLDDSFDDE